MSESGTGLPLRLRRKDIFFVLCFSFFAFSSFFSDSWHALGLLEGDGFWPAANRWYGELAQDHFFEGDHQFVRVNTGISGMIFGRSISCSSIRSSRGRIGFGRWRSSTSARCCTAAPSS